MSILIINKSNRKDLVRKQRACINEVNRHLDDKVKCREVIEDHIRWSNESGLFKDQRGRKLEDRHTLIQGKNSEIKEFNR